MSWLLFALIAHFLFALVFIIDKFIISKTVFKPVVYGVYTGLLQITVVFLIPFGFSIPSWFQIGVSLVCGALFTLAILALYYSFQMSEISRVTPVIGGAIPIITLILTHLFLGERLSFSQAVAFSLLVAGSIIMLWPKKREFSVNPLKSSWTQQVMMALLTAFLFASSFVLLKFIFQAQSFLNGFIWTRFGGVLLAGGFFLWPKYRRLILVATRQFSIKTMTVFFSDKVLGAIAFLLLNYAIFLGSVTLVNAMQGVQYAFLLLMAIGLSKKYPQILKEQISEGVIYQKIIAVLFIGIALAILVF